MFVTNAFVKGLESTGEYKAEILNISELNVKKCLGCLSCWGRTEGECIIKTDDVPMIKSKILAADIILVSFPLFYFGMPGEVKCLLDRLLSIMNTYCGQVVGEDSGAPLHGFRYDMSGKKLIVISGCAWNDDKVFNPLLGQLDCICGNGNYTAMFCPQIKAVTFLGGPRLDRYLARYEKAGAEFAANGGLSDETKALLKKTPFTAAVYAQVLENFWAQEREAGAANSAD